MSQKHSAHCIFCGRNGVTKQHVWPNWMKNHLPRSDSYHMQHLAEFDLSNLPQTGVFRPNLHFSKGPFSARKLRIACSSCNSGWMSQLESQAKPFLLSLISGAESILGTKERQALASWIVLFTVVAEYTDKNTISIPPADRLSLSTHLVPPSGWRIWLGLHDSDDWHHRFKHHAIAAYPPNEVHSIPAPYNCQFMTIGIGRVLFHAARTPFDPNLLRFSPVIGAKLVQLWPLTDVALHTSPMVPLLPHEAEAMSNEFAFP